MGKTTGFLDFERVEADYRPVAERILDYKDVVKYLSRDDIKIQATRCMDCGVPFCHSLGCPLHNLIPEWNDLVSRGKWKEALKRLVSTNPLPEVTGRICPAPCETSCTLSINDNPVTIRQIELAVIEYGFEKGLILPITPARESGKKIAVVGSGPAGLAAAWKLRELGHGVTVFEKSEKPGGLLRFGIPDFKLEKGILDRRIDLMKKSGIEFRTSAAVGETVSADELIKGFHAVLLAMGAGQPRDLKVEGRDLAGIHYALEFLSRSNMFVSAGKRPDPLYRADGKNVLVIGGGDTGSDCVGTSRRQGAKKVYLFEIMPKPREWDGTYNPQWPDWPLILRTSSSHEEGVERDWSVSIKKFTTGKNGVGAAHFARVEWKKNEKTGRMDLSEIPGSGFSVEAELVLLATGFVHVEQAEWLKKLGIGFNEAGNVRTTGDYSTSVKGIYAAGDAATGASLIVRAINHGLKAAENIDAYLKPGK